MSLLIAALLAAAPTTCRLPDADRRWLDGALANWRYAERVFLKQRPVAMPQVVAIGTGCVARGVPAPPLATRWRYEPHRGTATLPDGKRVPVGVLSFAAPASGKAASFFAMSTPAVWRAGHVTSELGLETLMDGVLLHEMTHTLQSYWATPTLDALQRRFGLADAAVNDDAVQGQFGKDPAYAAAYARERDLLFAAAAAPTDADARRLAADALAAMRARRERWLGIAPYWRDFDDIFLQMEGLGQWMIYRWYVDGPRHTYAPDVALRAVRRGGSQWTQDEGLALMLVVDRLVPDWQTAAFAPRPALAEALLARAADGR